jgi:hypothetical protein
MQAKEISIYELVKGVREDIKKIATDPDIKANPLLILKNVELSVNVVVSTATEAGIKFLIVTANAEYTKEKLASIRMTFEPIFKIEPVKTEVNVNKEYGGAGGGAMDY